MPFVKSIKIKPAVYEFRSEHFPSSYSVPKDVLRWGWFDVKELAEIAESSERHGFMFSRENVFMKVFLSILFQHSCI